MTLPWREAGVGAGLLGYEEYTVVQADDSTVTPSVTTEGVGYNETIIQRASSGSNEHQ